MYYLKILGFVLIVLGAVIAFGAKYIMNKYNLVEKAKCNFANEMNEEEIAQYKENKVILNLKIIGLLIAVPGFIIIMVVFR